MYKRIVKNAPVVSIFGSPRAFDTFVSQGYELNTCGFIRNDFAQLQESETTLGFARALAQMQEYTEEHSNEGLTFDEIIAKVRPRWCQLNGEVDRFEQFIIDNALDYYHKLKDSSTPQGKVVDEVIQGHGIEKPSEAATVN